VGTRAGWASSSTTHQKAFLLFGAFQVFAFMPVATVPKHVHVLKLSAANCRGPSILRQYRNPKSLR